MHLHTAVQALFLLAALSANERELATAAAQIHMLNRDVIFLEPLTNGSRTLQGEQSVILLPADAVRMPLDHEIRVGVLLNEGSKLQQGHTSRVTQTAAVEFKEHVRTQTRHT